MKTINIILLTFIFLSLNLLASNVATVTALKGEAEIKRGTTLLQASLGNKLEEKDNILTKNNSKLQIIFKDETIINLGKNSELSISQYLFEDKQEPIAKFNMLRGAMRTITGQIGQIAPQKFSVATRTATIGIRGTNFSIFVEDDGSSSAFCTFGAISVTVRGIVHVVNKGFYISMDQQGKGEVKEFSPQTLKEKREKYFTLKKKKEKRNNNNNEESLGSLDDSLLDISLDDNFGMIIDDISNSTQDAAQIDTSDLDNTDAASQPTHSTPTNAYP